MTEPVDVLALLVLITEHDVRERWQGHGENCLIVDGRPEDDQLLFAAQAAEHEGLVVMGDDSHYILTPLARFLLEKPERIQTFRLLRDAYERHVAAFARVYFANLQALDAAYKEVLEEWVKHG